MAAELLQISWAAVGAAGTRGVSGETGWDREKDRMFDNISGFWDIIDEALS
jgi:hypothetical protein